MEQQYLTIWDLVLTPLYLVVLIFVAKRIRDKRYPVSHPLRKYFLPGLLVKFGGAIFIALVYQYYYGGGDTYLYFTQSKIINSALDDSVSTWFKLLFRMSPEADPYIYRYSSQLYWYNDAASYSVPAIGAIFGLLNGTTYLPIALLFAFLSYTGIWAMYRTFVDIYPNYHKQLAIAFLFVPSTVIWGSALFKDTVCMFGIGWLTYTVFQIFLKRNLSLKNLFFLVFSFYLVFTVKVYILVAFVPALMVWLRMNFSGRIKSTSLRWTANIFFVSIAIAGLFVVANNFAEQLGRYSLENLASTAQQTQGYISNVSEAEGGSAYDLGQHDPTLTGMLSKFPSAVVVTLFRPFLWEAKKPIMLLSALEAFAFLLLSVLVFYRRGIGSAFKAAIADPTLCFFLIYSLIFAFAVGVSTGNFGTLSRYKIPCMPFFAAFLILLYSSRQGVVVAKSQNTRLKNEARPVHHLT